MSALSDLRDEIKTDLQGLGFQAFEFLPERISPPSAMVAAGSPYIEGGEGLAFCELRVRHEITLVVRPGANDVETDNLDEMLTKAILAVKGLERVDQPVMLSSGNAQYLAVKMTVVHEIHIEQEG